MAFLTGKKKATGTYRGVKVPISLKALLMLEERLLQGRLEGRMDFTCNIVAQVYGNILGTFEYDDMPRLRRTQWGKFLHALGVISGPLDAMLESNIPAWVRKLHGGGSLNQIRLALVRDILKEAHNHA